MYRFVCLHGVAFFVSFCPLNLIIFSHLPAFCNFVFYIFRLPKFFLVYPCRHSNWRSYCTLSAIKGIEIYRCFGRRCCMYLLSLWQT